MKKIKGRYINCGLDRQVGILFENDLAMLFLKHKEILAVGSLEDLERWFKNHTNDGYCYPWTIGKATTVEKAWLESTVRDQEQESGTSKATITARLMLER